MVLLFLSPVFYPVEALPENYRFLLLLNPLTSVIGEATARSQLWGQAPDWGRIDALRGREASAWRGLASVVPEDTQGIRRWSSDGGMAVGRQSNQSDGGLSLGGQRPDPMERPR